MDCKSSEEGDVLMANCNNRKCNAELDDTINRKCGAKGKKHISCAKDVLTDGLPVDRGWAWVVLFGCSMNMALVFGTLKAFGIYFVEFITVYDAKVSVTSLISGIQQGTYALFALPMLTFGTKYLTCRQASLTGGFLAGMAYVLGSQARSIYVILGTHGFLYGVALSCVFPSSSYLVGLYFDRRRSLAGAIILAGSSLGGLGLPPLFRFLLDTYGLRGALLVTGGILFQTMVSAMLMRPTAFYESGVHSRVEKTPGSDDKVNNPENVNMLEQVNTKGKQNIKNDPNIEASSPLWCGQPTVQHAKLNSAGLRISGVLSSTESVVERLSRSGLILSASKGDLVHISAQDLSATSARINYCSNNLGSQADCKKKDTSVNMFDFSVLRNNLFRLFLLVYILGGPTSAYIHIFIPPYAREKHISDYRIATIVSATNACDFLGRILGGVIVDRHILRSHTTAGITQLMAGVVVILSPLYQQYWSMMLFGIFDGLFAGSLFSLAPAVIADFIGIEQYRSAMGILLFFQGIALSSSAPVAGFLRDISGTYTNSFYMFSCSSLMAAILILVVPTLLRMCKRHDNVDEQETVIMNQISTNVTVSK